MVRDLADLVSKAGCGPTIPSPEEAEHINGPQRIKVQDTALTFTET